MTALSIARDRLIEAEGLSLTPYRDTEGYWTIGRGHKLPQDLKRADLKEMRWTLAEADAQFERDLRTAVIQAETFDWFRTLNATRRAVVIEMVYQLGLGGFRRFRRLIAALQAGNWATAAAEILDSKAAREQTPKRYQRLAAMMKRGRVV